MRIAPEEARRIAALAHLEFDDESLLRIAGELTRILEYIDQLNEVDISRAHELPQPEATPLAADEVRPSLPHDLVAANAPSFAASHFVVPKVIGGE